MDLTEYPKSSDISSTMDKKYRAQLFPKLWCTTYLSTSCEEMCLNGTLQEFNQRSKVLMKFSKVNSP